MCNDIQGGFRRELLLIHSFGLVGNEPLKVHVTGNSSEFTDSDFQLEILKLK